MTFTQSERFISGDPFIEGPTPARYWGDQWLRVGEKVLKGLNHQLTNRVASLEAALSLMQMDGAPDSGFTGTLANEVARMHELLQLYRAMTAEPIESPEPIRLQDLVPLVVRLHEHHCDLGRFACTVEGDPAAEPVFVRPAALQRCLLVLLASVAGNALRSRSRGPVSVSYGMSGSDVYLRLRGDAPSGQLLFSGEGSLLHAVRAALAHAQATADGAILRSETGDQIEYELRLPPLGTEGAEEA